MKKFIWIIIVLVVVAIAGFTLFLHSDESVVIDRLITYWNGSVNTFNTRATESGRFNNPSEIQFIGPDTMFIHYDDGLIDHISLIRYKGGSFTELKYLGSMSKLSEVEWSNLLAQYGTTDYLVSNYQSADYSKYEKVSTNLFK